MALIWRTVENVKFYYENWANITGAVSSEIKRKIIYVYTKYEAFVSTICG